MRYRNDLMLLRIAQADAFAAAVEYVKLDQHQRLHEAMARFDSYQQHPTHGGLRPGQFTDDTQMSVALAEALIAHGINATHEDLVAAWYNTFKRDPRDGYARGFQMLLESSTSADELRRRLVPTSNKNGAAMRSVPLGVIPSVYDLVNVASRQASTTHASCGGITSAIAVALMSHFALYDQRGFSSMLGWGNQHCSAFEQFEQPWEGPVMARRQHGDQGVGLNTAWAVHTLLVEETSLRGIMERVLRWGGDTDSVASIAWGIASCRYRDEALPEFLERDLEVGGAYGPEFLRDLGRKLMDAYDVGRDDEELRGS